MMTPFLENLNGFYQAFPHRAREMQAYFRAEKLSACRLLLKVTLINQSMVTFRFNAPAKNFYIPTQSPDFL